LIKKHKKMGNINRLELPQEIKDRVVLKNIKLGIGHDLAGMFCDIWLDKKNIGYYNNDGWGGEADIHISKESEQKLLQLLQAHNWRSRMYNELGWNFYENESKISDHSVIESLIEHLTDEKQKEKVYKKIAKQSEKEILWGLWDNYTRSGFKGGLSLEQMVRVYGVQKMQQFIDNQIKTKLQEGQEILNTNFEDLGLKK
jgi:hypothetical protein